MALRKVDAKEAAKSREERVLSFWHEHDVFHKSEAIRRGGPEWVFYEGPPTANGLPHPGHVLTRVFKDIYPRYRTMKGYHVERKAGWDTHGLPVEIEIEKKYGISGKKQIQEFGVERFVQECRSSVFKYEETWRRLTERLGYWTDLDHPYMTLTDDYIESVWNLLKTIYDKGLLEQGHRVSPYCPHCETTLSSHEVAQGYADVKDLSVTAKFRVKDGDIDGRPTYILAWTTTPWTLPSNVALAVHEDLQYVLIHQKEAGENVWVADGLKDNFLGEGDEIIAMKSGRDLVGTAYEPVFPYVTVEGKKHIVIASGHVTDESGTGIVHMAPAHGEDDYKACRNAGIVFINFVDYTGCFTSDVADYEGRFVKDEELNVDLVKSLAHRGVLYEKHKFEHSYPHCWRCDTPLIYYAIDSWFIRTTEVKDQLIANSKSVNWIPEHVRDGRMGNFLENVIDWNLSRSRYWGTPLPVWRCQSCGKMECIGSKAELEAKARRLPKELHKPYIDELTWSCECGGTMERVSEVIDVWFDSGSMPFAQLHYPFENQEAFKRLYPADYICEAIDQTRGWFYSLLAISTLVTGKAPYKNVLVLGHVLDEHGKKMSKSKGNVIDPFEAFDMHGADALRFYFISNTYPWNSQLFYHKAVAESKGKFIDLLQNIHAFYALYAGIDQFDPAAKFIPVADRPLMDRWITARLHQTVRTVDTSMDKYDATTAARALQAFVDELSTWYVRRNRDRFWAPGMEDDKVAAYLTLYEVLKTVALLAAPLTPFMAEELYQNIVRQNESTTDPVSVHLCDFPQADESLIDESLIREMAAVLRVVEGGRHLRNESKIKTRQPLSKLYVPASEEATLGKFVDIIKDELNVKDVVFAELDEIAKPELYLNLATVGKSFGKKTPVLNQAAKAASAETIAKFRSEGSVVIEGETLTTEHAEVRYAANFEGLISVDARGFVGLNTELTPELVEEGFVREIISKMQMMRKEVDYGVTHKVRFHATGDSEVLDILKRNRDRIAGTVLVREFVDAPMNDADLSKDWDVNGKHLTLAVGR
ncbi:isoleucine--tRNA ligase [Alicyclobacillus dauci]|uniref:Isoleucine--tRNA ligase n=1 Tax=Alicyclobacillus dauci TaxID=1475485 RepID=A0ABY6Z591_9BACL|nr:isoleucine--tRNA ligase [Alicyclobacillus dauci]WAH37915.1 isoleucine--tRNA ligase [Alicyclobacillus dauci]